MFRRAGLTINPFVFMLLLVLIGVACWRAWVANDILQSVNAAGAGGSQAYKAGVKMGVYLAPVLVTVLCCAVAGGVGAGLYFIFGRSEGAANLGIGLVLLIAISLYGYDTYLGATQPRTAPATATQNPGANLSRQMLDQMEAQRKAQQAQIDQLRERMIPVPVNPSSEGTGTQGPASASRPGPNAPASGTATPRPPLPAAVASDPEAERKAKAAIDPIRDELNAKTAAFLASANPLVDALGKPPKAIRSDLDARIKTTSEMKEKAAELETYLRSTDQRVESALKNAGIDLGEQIRNKVAFSQASDTFSKAIACGAYQRLFDAGLEETQTLRDNAGKWRFDAAGTITSTDTFLQSTLRRLREAVSSRLRDIPDAKSKLNRPS